jgi:hypothetical protein
MHPQQYYRRRQRPGGETWTEGAEVAELIRLKLIADGLFLVGIVGDKFLEVNVFSLGNLHNCGVLAGENFAIPAVESIERKLEIAKAFRGAFNNCALARLWR